MKKILVEIDCGDKYCGDCKFKNIDVYGNKRYCLCSMFFKSLGSENYGELKRLKLCVNAEAKDEK